MSEEFAATAKDPTGDAGSGESESSATPEPTSKTTDALPASAEGAGATVKVELEILGRAQSVVCRAGEEGRLRAHADELERRLVALGGKADESDTTRFLIAAALQLADELYEAHREHEAEVRRLQSNHLRETAQTRKEQEREQEKRIARHQAEAETRTREVEALRERLEQLLGALVAESPPS